MRGDAFAPSFKVVSQRETFSQFNLGLHHARGALILLRRCADRQESDEYGATYQRENSHA
jgi:hypothetical protein